MPAVARSKGVDSVLSPDGAGRKCKFPLETVTGTPTPEKPGQERVTSMGTLVVVAGDLVGIHSKSGCIPDVSTLSSFSSRVSAGGKLIGRIGDMYGDNIITSGSPRVFSS